MLPGHPLLLVFHPRDSKDFPEVLSNLFPDGMRIERFAEFPGHGGHGAAFNAAWCQKRERLEIDVHV